MHSQIAFLWLAFFRNLLPSLSTATPLQDYTVKRDWSLKLSQSLNGFGAAESPFRPSHGKPQIVAIDGRFVAFMCLSAYEAGAVDLESGQLLWRRILELSNQSTIFAQKCRVGYCSGVDIFVDPSKASYLKPRCDVQVLAISPDVTLFALDGRSGHDCQTPVYLFSQTPVSGGDTSSTGYGVTIPPIVAGDKIVVAMDTARASNIRGGYIETRSVLDTSVILLRKRYGSAFKSPLVYSSELDLLFAIVSPANSPYAPSAEDRFANSVLALRLSDLTVAWNYRFLYHDDFVFDYRHAPYIVNMIDNDGRKIISLFVMTPFGNIYWLDAPTGYERHTAQVRPLYLEKANLADERSDNWVRLSHGAFGNVFSDEIPSDDTKFSRFPNLELPDEGVLRLSPPGLLNGNLVVDPDKRMIYISFVQSPFFLEPPSAEGNSVGECSTFSSYVIGCQVPKPAGVALCPLSCESSFIVPGNKDKQQPYTIGHQWCANVSESGVTAVFLNNNSVAWSFALTPTALPSNNFVTVPQLLHIRAFDVMLNLEETPGLGQTIWLVDPFTRGLNIAKAEDGEIMIESDQFFSEDVVHWAKLMKLSDQLDYIINASTGEPIETPPKFLESSVLLYGEGHNWMVTEHGAEPTVTTNFRMALLRLNNFGFKLNPNDFLTLSSSILATSLSSAFLP